MVSGDKERNPQPARPRSWRGSLRDTGARLTQKKNRPYLAILAIGAVALLIAVLGTPIVSQIPALSSPEDELEARDPPVNHKDLKKQINDLRNLLLRLGGGIKNDVKDVRDQLDVLEANILAALTSQHARQANALLGAISALSGELAALQMEIAMAHANLEKQLMTLETNLQGAITRVFNALNNRLISLGVALDGVDSKLDDVKGTLDEVATAVGAIGRQLSGIQRSLGEISRAIGRVESSLLTIQGSLRDIDGKLDGIKTRLDETLVIRHVTSWGAAIEGAKPFAIGVSCTGNYLVKSLYADVSSTSTSTINVAYNQVRAKGDFTGTGITFWRIGSTSFAPGVGIASTLPYQILSQMSVDHPLGIPAAGLFVVDGEVRSIAGGIINVGAVVVTSGTSVCSTVISV